jgi:hypothetical protein
MSNTSEVLDIWTERREIKLLDIWRRPDRGRDSDSGGRVGEDEMSNTCARDKNDQHLCER